MAYYSSMIDEDERICLDKRLAYSTLKTLRRELKDSKEKHEKLMEQFQQLHSTLLKDREDAIIKMNALVIARETIHNLKDELKKFTG